MAIPKLYANLKEIPEKILDKFSLYLNSPLHNNHQETMVLWLSLREAHPDYDISDEALFHQAFPEKAYDNSRLRVLRSYLTTHLENFLIWMELEELPNDRFRLLRAAATRYGLLHIRKAAWETVAGPCYFEPELAMEEFLLRRDRLQLAIRDQNGSSKHDLNAVLQPLDAFYVLQRLKYLCALADPFSNQAPLEGNPELDVILNLYVALGMENQPLAAIYYHLLHLQLDRDEAFHTPLLRALLKSNRENLDPNEILNLYTNWYNFLNRRARIGYPKAMRAIFELYKDMIELDGFFAHGSFSAKHFRNITTVAISLKAFDWVESFLENNCHRLQKTWRSVVYAYCKGSLLFAKGEYAKAKKQLMEVEFLDPEYKISYEVLFIKIYFETDDLEGIESVKNALKIYLYRNQALASLSKKSANNFARFAQKLFHLKGHSEVIDLAGKILREIDDCEQLIARTWLKEKAHELMGRG